MATRISFDPAPDDDLLYADVWSASAAVGEATEPPKLDLSPTARELSNLRETIRRAFSKEEPLPAVIENLDVTEDLKQKMEKLQAERTRETPRPPAPPTDIQGKLGTRWLTWGFGAAGHDENLQDHHRAVHEKLVRDHALDIAAVKKGHEDVISAARQLSSRVLDLNAALKKHGDFAEAALKSIDALCDLEGKLGPYLQKEVLQVKTLRDEVTAYITSNAITKQVRDLAEARYELAYLQHQFPWLSESAEPACVVKGGGRG
jgi:hypothetical protein